MEVESNEGDPQPKKKQKMDVASKENVQMEVDDPEVNSSSTSQPLSSSPTKSKTVKGGSSKLNGGDQEMTTRRSSPRKAAMEARSAVLAAELSDDERDEVRVIKSSPPKPAATTTTNNSSKSAAAGSNNSSKSPVTAANSSSKSPAAGGNNSVKSSASSSKSKAGGTSAPPPAPPASADHDDSNSSDSIMELDAVDPLADSLVSSTEKTKPKSESTITTTTTSTSNGARIVTVGNVEDIRNLVKERQQLQQELEDERSKVTIIDPSKILAGKSVTITPAQPRVLPGGASIVRARPGSMPTTGATISPISRPGYAAVSSPSSAIMQKAVLPDKLPALPTDPNLTDDMFVLEAPSFVVPYVYEKPPKESFKEFNESVTKLAEEIKAKQKDEPETEKKSATKEVDEKKKKEKAKTSDDSSSESDDDADAADDDDDITEVGEVKKPSTAVNGTAAAYFESPIGKFLIDLGKNLVQEHVQNGLLQELMRKSQRDKSAAMMHSISSLKKNLQASQEKNKDFHFEETVKCHRCNFETESTLALADHQRQVHVKNGFSRCTVCRFDSMHGHEVLSHMRTVHGMVTAFIEPKHGQFECPQCDRTHSTRAQAMKHRVTCDRQFRADLNQAPGYDWEPAGKLPKHFNRNVSAGRPQFNFASQQFNGAAQRSMMLPTQPMQAQQQFANRMNTGYSPISRGVPTNVPGVLRHPGVGNAGLMSSNPRGQYNAGNAASLLLNSLAANSSLTVQSIGPSRTGNGTSLIRPTQYSHPSSAMFRPQQQAAVSKAGLVICEICDGYIKDLEQLKNHMNWIHKIKIHPKMIHQRPPLNCQKCQSRFFTDQGLERHLLGSHGLVTAAMQDMATTGQDSGRCPLCGKVFTWKLLAHVAKDHDKVLKPAHLSYKCTVCDANFSQYKAFETHVYATHGSGAKKANADKESESSSSTAKESSGSGPTSAASSAAAAAPSSSAFSNSKPSSAVTIKPIPKKTDNEVIELDDDDTGDTMESQGASSTEDESKSRGSSQQEQEVQEISDDD